MCNHRKIFIDQTVKSNTTCTALPKPDFKTRLHNLNSLLLIAFGFVLPLSVALANIIALLIVLLWLMQANFRNDVNKLRNNTLVRAILAFWLLHLIGLLWTSDLSSGLQIIAKESILLLLPIFMMVLSIEYRERAIGAFMASMLLSCTLSFLMWFQVIPPSHFMINEGDPIAFMGRISYAPFLTIAIYISLFYLLLNPTSGKKKKILAAITAVFLSINIFIINGRAGQVSFFVMIVIVIFQYYSKNLLRALTVAAIALPLLIFTTYNFSSTFRERIKLAISEVEHYGDGNNTSVGLRIAFTRNSLDIIRENALFGVGTGDFSREYATVNKRNTPTLLATSQPHNMYILELVQFGVIGLAALLSILYAQIRISLHSSIPLQKYFGLALPILFAIIMLSDSYLLGHFTTMLFVFFSAILYQDYS
jgi:O-antigen ligase